MKTRVILRFIHHYQLLSSLGTDHCITPYQQKRITELTTQLLLKILPLDLSEWVYQALLLQELFLATLLRPPPRDLQLQILMITHYKKLTMYLLLEYTMHLLQDPEITFATYIPYCCLILLDRLFSVLLIIYLNLSTSAYTIISPQHIVLLHNTKINNINNINILQLKSMYGNYFWG